jgi:thermostable 8-oxoguanine DNA glycosylase
MVNNMKKSSIINEKSNQYHEKEWLEAEDILKKLYKDNK